MMELKIATFAVSLFVLICVLAAYSNKKDKKKLELVQMLFRHGERTPRQIEIDVFKLYDRSAYEPYDLGELTNRGKYQMYNIGVMLRDKYRDFLNEKYKEQDVYAYSTYGYRARMSVQLVLAGLYPPSKEFLWNPDIKWQPIPSVSIPYELDVILSSFLSKKFWHLYKNETDHISMAKAKAEYVDIIKILKERHGFIFKKPSDFGTIHNILYCNEQMNLTLPDWYDEKMRKRFKEMVSFRLDCMSYTNELKRMNGGTTLRRFLENMNINGTNKNPRKVYLYGGHDLNVAAVARILQLSDFNCPGYGDGLIFEKWRDSTGQLYVKIIGWNGIEGKLRDLKLKNCEEYCPIEDFLWINRDYIPSDREMNYLLDDFEGSIVHDSLLRDQEVETPKVYPQITHDYF